MERHIILGGSPETMWKLCLATKFPHQEMTWNYGIFRSTNLTRVILTLVIKGIFIHFMTSFLHIALLMITPWLLCRGTIVPALRVELFSLFKALKRRLLARLSRFEPHLLNFSNFHPGQLFKFWRKSHPQSLATGLLIKKRVFLCQIHKSCI